MKTQNLYLIKAALRMRNRISVGKNSVLFPNSHSAHNDILIEGENSSLSFVGPEGYSRSGRVIMRGKGNIIKAGNNTILVNGCSIRLIGDNNAVSFGENCHIENLSIYVLGNNNRIVIGNDVSSIFTSFHIEENNNSIIVGNRTTFHGRDNNRIELALDEGTSVLIGENCMISNDVSFRSSDSHSILGEKGKRINFAANILIKDHVWIGMRSLILKNTVIHKNCIIGAGSICNKDYGKDNCMIAGNPAKIVKEDVDWSRDRL